MTGKYHVQEGMMDSYGITDLKDFGCTSSQSAQYRWRLAKDWERPTKRAMMVIIMQSDEAILNQAWKLYRYSETKDHQGLTDFLYSLKYA